MAVTREAVMQALARRLSFPAAAIWSSRDLVRALAIEGDRVRFVIEAADPDAGPRAGAGAGSGRGGAARPARGGAGAGGADGAWPGGKGAAAEPEDRPAPDAAAGRAAADHRGGPDHRHRHGQGRGGQIDRLVQPCGGAGAAGAAGRSAGCRYLWSVAAADDGGVEAPRLARRQDDHSAAGAWRHHDVDRPDAEGGRGGGLARADDHGGACSSC